MDGSTFDRLTQLMAGSTRRLALKSALGGAVAVAGLAAASPSSEAKNKNKKAKRCKKKLKKCRRNQPPACEALEIGQPCETSSQCCGTETNLACSLRSEVEGSDTACCGTATVPCTQNSDCCRGFACGLITRQCLVSLF